VSPSLVDRFGYVKDRVETADILAKVLGPSRRRLFLCPLHPDKNPSLSEREGGVVCFGCGFRGDIFRFIQEHLGLDPLGSLHYVAEIGGVILPTSDLPQSLPKYSYAISQVNLEKGNARMGREIESMVRGICAEGGYRAHRLFREGHWEEATKVIGNVIALESILS